ncbi:MAG: DUF2905 domain-containing protein [Deltaproteobacteria bacterium]|nr:MAG: DUF2905 domain-containing protein [Deltaproteobacteria bacterium]
MRDYRGSPRGTLEVGKTLIAIGIVFILAGVALQLGWRLWPGRLPGDIVIERRNVTIFFPIVTCLVISVVLTILANWLRR